MSQRIAHIARKRFGQHFLTDQLIIAEIVEGIQPKAGQWMVEIGPGLAAMTQPLVERVGRLTVIELDRDLVAQLRQHPQLEVIASDVLKVDFRQVWLDFTQKAQPLSLASTSASVSETATIGAPKLRVVGNLPYNISTPILFHLLNHVDVIQDQHFMLQKEVIDRMVAAPDSSDYSRLSVMLQWRYDMHNILFVPPSAFEPPPRVDSAIVRMLPIAMPPQVNISKLSELVQVAFSQRRKLMRHTLGKWLEQTSYTGNFDLQRRAQEVPVHEFVTLAQAL